MNWLIISLLAPAVLTVVNYIDKYIVEEKIKDYRGLPIYGTIMAAVFGTLFWILSGFPHLPPKDAAIILFTGVLTIWSTALYFKALSQQETSEIIILFQLTPLLTLVLSYFILGDTITFKQLIGFIILFVSVIAVSVERGKQKFKLTEAFWLILAVDLMWAVSAILIKFALEANSISKIVSYESWGITIGGILLYVAFPTIRKAFIESITTIEKKILGVMFFNEGVFVLTKCLTFLAYSLGPVALVSILGSTNVFFGILYGLILSVLAPKVFKEEGAKDKLLKKVVATILLFIGIVLIY